MFTTVSLTNWLHATHSSHPDTSSFFMMRSKRGKLLPLGYSFAKAQEFHSLWVKKKKVDNITGAESTGVCTGWWWVNMSEGLNI